MTETAHICGGCFCGALRYEATVPPTMAGYCCCRDCRKITGSGFIGFMGFPGSHIRFTGETRQLRAPSFRGTVSVRNFCALCGSLVFGGTPGVDTSHTVYAGSLDEPSQFHPTIAIFDRDRPDWVILPPGLKIFETIPGAG